MVKVLIALCALAAVQASPVYEVAVPIFKQPYGDVETRIIGGEPAAKGQFPHQVGITMDDAYFCGGSVISKNWVLTAAHCVDGFKKWSVVLGAQNIRNASEPGRITVATTKAVRKEDYDSSNIINDVGLVNLPAGVQFSETIKPIALPPRSLKDKNLVGQTARVSGWGKTSDVGGISPTLQYVDLKIGSIEECRKAYGDQIPNTQYCCNTADKRSTCNGDSGGSLTLGKGADLINIGIVSYGSSRGCTAGYPVGFTATPYFVDWVSNKTGIPIKN